jgi:hypothetical protein
VTVQRRTCTPGITGPDLPEAAKLSLLSASWLPIYIMGPTKQDSCFKGQRRIVIARMWKTEVFFSQ